MSGWLGNVRTREGGRGVKGSSREHRNVMLPPAGGAGERKESALVYNSCQEHLLHQMLKGWERGLFAVIPPLPLETNLGTTPGLLPTPSYSFLEWCL